MIAELGGISPYLDHLFFFDCPLYQLCDKKKGEKKGCVLYYKVVTADDFMKEFPNNQHQMLLSKMSFPSISPTLLSL